MTALPIAPPPMPPIPPIAPPPIAPPPIAPPPIAPPPIAPPPIAPPPIAPPPIAPPPISPPPIAPPPIAPPPLFIPEGALIRTCNTSMLNSAFPQAARNWCKNLRSIVNRIRVGYRLAIASSGRIFRDSVVTFKAVRNSLIAKGLYASST